MAPPVTILKLVSTQYHVENDLISHQALSAVGLLFFQMPANSLFPFFHEMFPFFILL
jgi:hypothetical protein